MLLECSTNLELISFLIASCWRVQTTERYNLMPTQVLPVNPFIGRHAGAGSVTTVADDRHIVPMFFSVHLWSITSTFCSGKNYFAYCAELVGRSVTSINNWIFPWSIYLVQLVCVPFFSSSREVSDLCNHLDRKNHAYIW